MPLHWLAGTGFDEAIDYLLGSSSSSSSINHENNAIISLAVDQPAHHPSTARTPLHYAARNGHLSTCQLLIERYGANPHPKCGRGGVTPLQLAVWQNRLDVVKFLIQKNGTHVTKERNDFNCGLNHWLGLIPRKRWCSSSAAAGGGGGGGGGGSSRKRDDDATACHNSDEQHNDDDDGSGVLPLARYLHTLGISYESTPDNSNTQGHTCNHKAAWGGNLPLLKYFRNEHGVYDTIQDAAGNYCADIAKMRGNMDCYQWLLEHGSGDRAESYKVLGLDVGVGMDIVRRRYMELAKLNHPDKAAQYYDTDNDEKKDDVVDDFIKIKQAYDHLTKQNGIGTQKNPKYDELRLLECQKKMKDDGGGDDDDYDDDDDLFVARLIAVITDYGEKGFPVGLLSRRWNQIWPDRPFPTEYVIERSVKSYNKDGGGRNDGTDRVVIQGRVKLVKWLKWKCRGTNVKLHQNGGEVLAVIDNKSTF
jgi:ankyrin repeat protein